MRSYLEAFADVVFPRPCAGCSKALMASEKFLCLNCSIDLPYTRYENLNDSPIEQLFWGKVKLRSASAMWHFTKGGKVQNILHRIKYKGDKALAEYIGKLMAERLQQSPRFLSLDAILPVPLHPSKLRKRGFNQSELLARSISEKLQVPFFNDCLIRKNATETQTRKNRIQRWRNVGEVFSIEKSELIENSNILLIDDVITTGATLEGCIIPLKDHTNARVSVYAAAVA